MDDFVGDFEGDDFVDDDFVDDLVVLKARTAPSTVGILANR